MIKSSFYLTSIKELSNWIDNATYSSLFVICDQNTVDYCLPIFKDAVKVKFTPIEIKGGEEHKTLVDCEKIWQRLIDKEADRQSIVINLGGGMVTDIGAFAAATLKRGIRFINIPTTLLGMVDASIGNKTGINFKKVKNQIGTFSKPENIVIDDIFLKTLPKEEYLSGLGEVFKYGFIHCPELLKRNYLADKADQNVIEKCIAIKDEIVANDPLEKGFRQILNFGHTIGHAIESYSMSTYTPLKHGEAVAWGMLAECHISQERLGFNQLEEVAELVLKTFKKPSFLKHGTRYQEVSAFTKFDKKNVNGEIRCTLLKSIGEPVVGQVISEKEIELALEWLKTA